MTTEGKRESRRRELAASHTTKRAAAAAANDAVFDSMDERAARQFFSRRGFSDETVRSLISGGIAFPEELLFKTAEQIEKILGPARRAIEEVHAYRRRFLPKQQD